MGWEDRDYYREGPTRIGPGSVTLWFIIINVLVLVADGILGGSQRASVAEPAYWCVFNVGQAFDHLQLWRCLTYQFIHRGSSYEDAWVNLIFSMIGLYFFGPQMEQWWGTRRFIAFYLLCGCLGFIPYTLLLFCPLIPHTPVLYASWGATFGMLFGCAAQSPRAPVSMMFLPITMTMRTMALIYVGVAVLMVLVGSMGADVMAAHICGAASAIAFVRWPWLLSFAEGISFGFIRRARQNARRRMSEARERRTDDQQVEVDRILDKVRAHGLHSLNRAEKRALQRATENKRRAG